MLNKRQNHHNEIHNSLYIKLMKPHRFDMKFVANSL